MLILLVIVGTAFVFLMRQTDAELSEVMGDGGDEDFPLGESDVNSTIVSGYVAGAPSSITVARIDVAGHVLRADAAQAFNEMKAAALLEGIELHVNSAWRSMEQQQKLFAAYQAGTGNLAAQPGFSNHQSGTAVDVETSGGTNEASHWLEANALTYGFRRTVSTEPWHYEYSA